MNCKALTMSLLVAIIMLLPFAASAQRSDSFFSGFEDDDYENRIAYIGLGNQPFGTEPAPVGSGLLVLTVAGAGYAALRRKRSDKSGKSRKTYTTCVLALAMVLAFTGCKKKIEPVVNSGETAHITLNVGNGNRHIIEPNESGYVPVSYSAGDVIYVGDGTQCVGQLSWDSYDDNNNSIFSGSINEPSGNKIYFYFIGGKNDVVASGTTSFTVDISDQHTNLPVLSCIEAEYYSGKTEFTCMLENKCALVEFKFANGTDALVGVSNMLSEAKVDFGSHSITPTGKLDAIMLYPDQNEASEKKWAILLPGEQRDAMGMVKYSIIHDNSTQKDYNLFDYYDGVVVDALNNGDYKYGDDAVAVNNNTTTFITNKVFMVSEKGNAVRFSPGNLQYQPSTDSWRFAPRQWDVVGRYNNTKGSVYENNSWSDNRNILNVSYDGWMDLFGWGCTGNPDGVHNTNQTYYSPMSTDYSNSTGGCNLNYGPTGSYDLSVSNKSDWGCVNITNNPNNKYKWRLLTNDEWRWLHKYYNDLDVARNLGMARITFNEGELSNISLDGIIILPYGVSIDGFVHRNPQGGTPVGWTNNSITPADWTSMEEAGAVFLPWSFMRYKNNQGSIMLSNVAYYWSSTPDGNDKARYASVNSSSGLSVGSSCYRSYGCAVRLVR